MLYSLGDYSFRLTLNLTLNCYAIVSLLLMYYSMQKHVLKSRTDNRLFSRMALVSVILIAVDSLTWILNYPSGPNVLNFLSNTLFFLLLPLPSLFCSMYVHFKVYMSIDRLTGHLKLFCLPYILNVVLVAYNTVCYIFAEHLPQGFNWILFSVNAGNEYTRGYLFFLTNVITYLYVLYSVIMLIRRHKLLLQQSFVAMIYFLIPPVLGSIVQIFVFGISSVFLNAIAIQLLFSRMQNDLISVDHLTGLYNRFGLEEFLYSEFSRHDNFRIAGIMLDIDNFKKINDTHGHPVGDRALCSAAKLLRKATGNDDFLARYAGDEFVIIMSGTDEDSVVNFKRHLNEILDKYNATANLYRISFSIGYAFSYGAENDTVDDFLRRMDEKMYIEKHEKQLARESK